MGSVPWAPSADDRPNELLNDAPSTVTLLKRYDVPAKFLPLDIGVSLTNSSSERLVVGSFSIISSVTTSCAPVRLALKTGLALPTTTTSPIDCESSRNTKSNVASSPMVR